MSYLNLIYDFLMIGLFSFGGGYTTIPMIKDIVDKYDILTMEMIENFIAISESTPGPIAINLATFVGNEIAGLFGGVVATFFEILPAFIIILIFVVFFKKYINNNNVKFTLSVIRPSIVGIIMAVGVSLYVKGILYTRQQGLEFLLKYVIISVLVLAFMFIYNKVFKKKVSAIRIIVFGAVLGIILGFIWA